MYVEVPNALRKNRLAGPPNPAIPAWLGAIPSLVEAAAERWALTVLPAFDGLSYNYVAPVVRADGTPAVLKVRPRVVPDPSATTWEPRPSA